MARKGTFEQVGPVLTWLAVAVVAYFLGKSFLKGLLPQPSITPTDEPVLPPTLGSLSAEFIQPKNNGLLKSSLYPFAEITLKIAVNNPGLQSTVDLRVPVTFYPRVLGSESSAQAGGQFAIPHGRSVHEVRVRRPVFTFGPVIDAVAEVYINGRSVAVPVLFTIDD